MGRFAIADNFERLLQQEDTDGDRRITIRDKGPRSFLLRSVDGADVQVRGTYALSNLLQELAAARHAGLDFVELDPIALEENPLARLSRVVRERCWRGLTRCLDGENLEAVLRDPKGDGRLRLYVPAEDRRAWQYYESLRDERFDLVRLPAALGGPLTSLNEAPGLLTLAFGADGEPLPYIVPGGRFNEMYGWDSYFIALGLLQDGERNLAECLLEHMLYEVRYYGQILNANRTYYLTRSQPPFLTALATALGRSDALPLARRELEQVWLGPTRLVPSCGLSRYFCRGIGMPPETLMRHYGAIMAPFAQKMGLSLEEFRQAYQRRQVTHLDLDAYFIEDRAVRESGHDTSYRLEGRCTRLCTVDLNSLLYRYEVDLGLREQAEARRERLTRYCWDPQAGQFFDYDWISGRPTGWESPTNLFPLWAGLATREQAAQMVEQALPRLVERGGVAGSSLASRGELTPERNARQWDYPYGWAPHQMLLWEGLRRYGYDREAADLAHRWLRMIVQNAVDFNGVIPEKYDVVAASHEVFAEYVNVGADFAYLTEEGFGWTNASLQVGQTYLTAEQRLDLERIRPSNESGTAVDPGRCS